MYIYINIYPRALRATLPPCLTKTKSKTEKETKTVLFLDAPGVPQTSLLGAPGLHFETPGVHFGYPASQGRQRSSKGPQMKKRVCRNRQQGDFGTPLGSLWDHVGDFFLFFYVKVLGLDSGRVFFTIFCRKATSAQRLHVAKA